MSKTTWGKSAATQATDMRHFVRVPLFRFILEPYETLKRGEVPSSTDRLSAKHAEFAIHLLAHERDFFFDGAGAGYQTLIPHQLPYWANTIRSWDHGAAELILHSRFFRRAQFRMLTFILKALGLRLLDGGPTRVWGCRQRYQYPYEDNGRERHLTRAMLWPNYLQHENGLGRVVRQHTLAEYRRKATSSIVAFSSSESFPSSVRYPITIQEANNAPVTLLGLRVSLSVDDYLLFDGLHAY
ncbi:hypothetical protein EVAR_4510_1 [Eumeta japonica]|uniref:Uncharacterized protein n=1 Tax=Eumeta variegata TaxID=151549 RepID=A0A4C1SWN2_EUMVA|nr:hypothetical protein EVAR_4510_1 [Eumeta japonica]